MKTRKQKEADLKAAGDLMAKSQTLVFTDFGSVASKEMQNLRRAVRAAGGEFKVVKKRLLGVLFKEKGIDYDVRQFDGSVGTVFAEKGLDTIGAPIYKFFHGLGADTKAKAESVKKILGAYDLEAKAGVPRETVMMIAQLPSREVLLSQLLGMLSAPMSQLMYTLQQKSEK